MHNPSHTYISDRQIAERFSISRSTLWRWVAQGNFPAPFHLSPGCTRWRLSCVEAWEAERNKARTSAA
ncbi:MAG: AlpA family phage regulatory protein [Pseudomonadota bacterium]